MKLLFGVLFFGLLAVGAAIVTKSTSGSGEDRMVLGPRQFAEDKSGAGAVLCVWSLYLSIQSRTAACHFARRPVDDAIDKAVSDIDQFILANSSLHPSREALEDFKRRAVATEINQLSRRGPKAYCEGPFSKDIEMFRSMSPYQVSNASSKLLSVPREPVMNPCL